MKRILWALAGLVVLVLVPLGAAGYLTFLQEPDNTPEGFLESGRAPGTDTLVVAAGSSSTRGTAGADYVEMLRERLAGDGYEFVNAGVNGATSGDLLAGLETVIACEPDAVALFVGANDARDPETSVADYRETMDRILTRLTAETDAEIALIPPQPPGQAPAPDWNAAVDEHSAVLAELAEAHGATYLPTHEELEAVIAAGDGPGTTPEFSAARVYTSGLLHYIGRMSWDEIGERNGYVAHTDGLHMNDTGATVVADRVESWLAGGEG